MKYVIPIILIASIVLLMSKDTKKPIVVKKPVPDGSTPSNGNSLYGIRKRFLPQHINA